MHIDRINHKESDKFINILSDKAIIDIGVKLKEADFSQMDNFHSANDMWSFTAETIKSIIEACSKPRKLKTRKKKYQWIDQELSDFKLARDRFFSSLVLVDSDRANSEDWKTYRQINAQYNKLYRQKMIAYFERKRRVISKIASNIINVIKNLLKLNQIKIIHTNQAQFLSMVNYVQRKNKLQLILINSSHHSLRTHCLLKLSLKILFQINFKK